MPITRMYLKSVIKKIHNTCYMLEMHYNYCGLYNFIESFVGTSLPEIKDILIRERCHNQLTYELIESVPRDDLP